MVIPTGIPLVVAAAYSGPIVSAINMSDRRILDGRLVISPALLLPSFSPRSVAPEIHTPASTKERAISKTDLDITTPPFYMLYRSRIACSTSSRVPKNGPRVSILRLVSAAAQRVAAFGGIKMRALR